MNARMSRSRCAAALLALMSTTQAARATQQLGLYAPDQWLLSSGSCQDCGALPQALWYFQEEAVAVPRRASAVMPPLVWLGGAGQYGAAQLDRSGSLSIGGKPQTWRTVERLASNRSWLTAASWRFFAQRQLTLRADPQPDGSLTVRNFWPADYSLRDAPLQALAAGESLQQLVRADAGGARADFQRRVVWQRSPDALLQPGRTVVGLMLNGAQGDDDEAHGGHFAVLTGQWHADGHMQDWMVNNFYNLDSVSEKGIIAAATPLDSYLAEFNSGQQWYRPSYMLVAVLRDGRSSAAVQQALNQVMRRFYLHEQTYDHVRSNCTGLSVDALRQLGWAIPQRGASSRIKALGAYFYVGATERSLSTGRKMYDYFNEEQTRLYPAVAFESAGEDLLQLARGETRRELTAWERELAASIEALVWVRVPQFPSSRSWGSAPVWSLDEYLQRTPADRSQWQIVPVGPRPFPQQWRPPVAPAQPAVVPWPVVLLLLLPPLGLLLWWQRRRAAKGQLPR